MLQHLTAKPLTESRVGKVSQEGDMAPKTVLRTHTQASGHQQIMCPVMASVPMMTGDEEDG